MLRAAARASMDLPDDGGIDVEGDGLDPPPGEESAEAARPVERPVAAEGRLRRAFYQCDLKVIEDERRRPSRCTTSPSNPGERHNLFDTQLRRVSPAVAASRAFFAAHELRRPGYAPPYKP